MEKTTKYKDAGCQYNEKNVAWIGDSTFKSKNNFGLYHDKLKVKHRGVFEPYQMYMIQLFWENIFGKNLHQSHA